MLYLKSSTQGSVTIYKLEGAIERISSSQLQRWLSAPLPSGVTSLVLDFSQVDYITSAGQRVLLAYFVEARSRVRLMIRNASLPVVQSLALSGLDRLYQVTAKSGSARDGRE